MSLLIGTHFRLACESIKRNRGRSFLTCLGIAIGVASIVLILSLMGSVRTMISTQVQSAGADLVLVRPSIHQDSVDSFLNELTSKTQFLRSNLTLKDVNTIRSIDGVSAAAPLASTVTNLTTKRIGDDNKPYEFNLESGSLIGTNADFAKIENLKLKDGVFLSEDTKAHNAVIGRELSARLFSTQEPIGRMFSAFGIDFLVTGLLEPESEPINYNNINFDSSVFVSADLLDSVGEKLQVQQISIKAKNTGNLPELSEAVSKKLTETKNGDTNFTVTYGDQITHPAGSFLTIISGMLAIVAGISLVVGGIGVMNIMLVSVGERIREIGIRKSVGATGGNILLQFLFEALILSSLGGIGGLTLGYVIAFLISCWTPFHPYIDGFILLITLITSIVVGLIFGIYPAAKAARRNPIDSLRYYR